MQKLEVFQSLWAMEQRIPGQVEASVDEQFQRIAAAGFHGVCIDPSLDEIADMRKLKPLFEQHDLNCMVNVFPHTLDEMRPLLEFAREMNACQVNALGTLIPLQVGEGATMVRRWLDEAAEVGIPLLFETHRDSLLNDLGYTLMLLDAVPEMRLCADLSHFVVDREIRLPLNARDHEYFQRLLQRADCFQGRVASAEQVQVQLSFPQHQKWVDQFRAWWAEGMKLWRQSNPEDATLVFLCELGPPPYAITGADGRELSDRWEEALQIRAWVGSAWAELA
ncbi:MAG: hypothetical protein SH820_10870 [Xanthomonadales bacterium]|nr:hypothetical protein [Xanthomonadales bacterium]